MALLRIRQFGDPVLRTRAREVDSVTDLHRRLIADMLETMRAAPGVGLAGNQVGVLERIFVWEVEEESGAVINPVIKDRSDETEAGEEGCLSMPGIVYDVERARDIVMEGLDGEGEPITLELSGFHARVFQHEIDHLDGVLFTDRLAEDQRREALAILRDQALGLAHPSPAPAEETL